MAKQIKWIDDTRVEVEALDGPATGKYLVDINDPDNTPCGGLITIGYLGRQAIKIATDDIPDYNTRYAQTPKALRTHRRDIIAQINCKYDDQEYTRNKWFEREAHTTNIPQYGGDEVAKLEAELKAFDETHPEIIAQITKEREEATERHLWD